MRIIKTIATLLVLIQLGQSVEIYQSIRVYGTDSETLSILHKAGIPLDHVYIKKGVFIDIIAHDSQREQLEKQGLVFDILIDDMTQYFMNKNIPEVRRDFELGSMKGNYTYSEIVQKMDTLAVLYPDFISPKDSIGSSVQGRTIWAFNVSDNPLLNENEPEVLFTALTHAREPLSMMNLFYFTEWLCENYNTNSLSQYLIDNRQLWFIPVINPDGYVYNETIAPTGGGMHRKNRQDTGCGNGTQRGVDLNRNYSYEWGVDNSGSSPDFCSATFRGDSSFSEPETQAVRDFILAHNFSNVLHYHSYSNVLIHSWGNGDLPSEPDLTTYREIGRDMTDINGYQVGTGHETIGYGVNGDAVDWTYGAEGIISYTPEVGSYQDNFWPSENRVIPLCEDQLYANQIFSLVGGADYVVSNAEIENVSKDTVQFTLTIQNRGLVNSNGTVSVDVKPFNGVETFLFDDIDIGELIARNSFDLESSFIIPELIPDGIEVGFTMEIFDNSSFIRYDTLTIITGYPTVIYSDNAETGLDGWDTNGSWGQTSAISYSGDYSFTDSPNGNYNSNTVSTLSLVNPISFEGINFPMVKFAAKWAIEENWDFIRFQISTDNSHWESLSGEFTHIGSGQGAQPSGEPGYEGTSDWIMETINLSSFTRESEIYFRFIFTSDEVLNFDGFYFDDFSVTGYPTFLPGDLDGDEDQTIFDVLSIADVIINHEELNDYQRLMADVNFDGQVTISDVAALMNLILNF